MEVRKVVFNIPMNTSDEILPNLWMGNIMSAQLVHGFDLVVNMAQDSPMPDTKEYYHWDIPDAEMPDDLGRLNALVTQVCRTHALGGKVLIHCNAGVNRSGLVTALVVRQLKGLTGTEAIDLVRSKRPKGPFPNIICNPHFESYLNTLEKPDA